MEVEENLYQQIFIRDSFSSDYIILSIISLQIFLSSKSFKNLRSENN